MARKYHKQYGAFMYCVIVNTIVLLILSSCHGVSVMEGLKAQPLVPKSPPEAKHEMESMCEQAAFPDTCMRELSRLLSVQSARVHTQSFSDHDEYISAQYVVGLLAEAAQSRAAEALQLASQFSSATHMQRLARLCSEDCVELMNLTHHHLQEVVDLLAQLEEDPTRGSVIADVKFYLSSCLSYQSACYDGIIQAANTGAYSKATQRRHRFQGSQEYLFQVIGNVLTLVHKLELQYAASFGTAQAANLYFSRTVDALPFPDWLSPADRQLLLQSDSTGAAPASNHGVEAQPQGSPSPSPKIVQPPFPDQPPGAVQPTAPGPHDPLAPAPENRAPTPNPDQPFAPITKWARTLNAQTLAPFTNAPDDFKPQPPSPNRPQLLISSAWSPSPAADSPASINAQPPISNQVPTAQSPAPIIAQPPTPNAVVAKDGSGKFRTVDSALLSRPPDFEGRFVVYVKAGVYREFLNISKQMENVSLMGDGMDRTIITGNRNVALLNFTTFRSSTVGVSGDGFFARDITFRNTAGPRAHQAVALRANADRAVFYRCRFDGFQDTLYALSGRQFYRDCEISGTVDMIFGYAIAVFQNCKLLAKRPMKGQPITLSAQGRKLFSDVNGFVFHNCTVAATMAMMNAPYNVFTYLGRPWKEFSRVVFLQSELGALIHPHGWLHWNQTDPFVTTLFYGECQNRGPGSAVDSRVSWPGVHANMSLDEAEAFTLANFVEGNSWISAVLSPRDFFSGLL
ncbi:hypothetical protein L7F22_016665 [Adiantum nelumboides]|nr:hypothetical protein [Adiantum nelumboides]